MAAGDGTNGTAKGNGVEIVPDGEFDPKSNKTITIGGTTYQRLSGSLLEGTDRDEVKPWTFNPIRWSWWVLTWAIPGMGMFLEAYFIFSIGNISPLLEKEYPNCWKKYTSCGKTLTEIPSYIQIVGIILGMMTVGFLGDRIGRKWGSVTTVSIMFVGAVLLTAQHASTEKGQTIFYIIAQFVIGYGVGGEYPMAAGSAAERAETGGIEKARARGREVVLTFSMQGVGNFVNVGVLLILLCICNVQSIAEQTSHPNRLGTVWRLAFGLGIIPIVGIWLYRVFVLKESKMWHRRSGAEKAKDIAYLSSFYWSRMVATAGCWFFWDFSFYGNRVFQSAFITILTGGTSGITTTLAWTLLNAGVALFGYYMTAWLIDNINWGRYRIQQIGFVMVSILYFVMAGKFLWLSLPSHVGLFQFLYFFSAFWSQFGPNCTTFLLAGELYPTQVRTTAHGFSAGFAKLGGLWATIFFNYIGSQPKFWWCAALNTAGIFLTFLFVPEPLRVPLSELDRRYEYHQAGRVYHGEAVNPVSLSLFERVTGVGKDYNKQLDREDLYDDQFQQSQAGAKTAEA